MADTRPTDPGPDTAELMAAVYDELRALAAHHLRGERLCHTLQPTALVHEAYLRLAGLDHIRWRDERHFCIAASGVIRRVLVDHARTRATAKRGGGQPCITLEADDCIAIAPDLDVLVLDEAMMRLADLDERKCRVVELRFFGGLTIQGTADALGVGTTTIEDDWAFARAWLRRAIAGETNDAEVRRRPESGTA